MKNLIRIQKKCEWCGEEFTAYKCTTRFCSKRCAEHAHKDKLRKQKVQFYKEELAAKEQQKLTDTFAHRDYLTPPEVAQLFGVDRVTIYRYIWDGKFSCVQFKGKTFIRRQDIDKLFNSQHPYQKRHKKERAPITELYTTAEVQETFNVSASWVFQVGKEENIPRVFQRGKTYWSKKHFDTFFAKKATDESITEWYSVEDMKKKFNMTTSAVYCFVSKFAIPKRKVKREVFYSQKHVDAAKGLIKMEVEYYTVPEAMEKFGLTRDQLYHYVKRGNVPKKKEGKYTKIAKKELDELLAPPII